MAVFWASLSDALGETYFSVTPFRYGDYIAKFSLAPVSPSLTGLAGKEVVISLLDVLDDCDRAEKQLQAADNIDQIREGVQLVFSKLRATLYARGLKAMNSIHTDFDVEKHEAISEVPAPSPDLVGKVIAEVTKGYYLNDKIIRFAKVIVGK